MKEAIEHSLACNRLKFNCLEEVFILLSWFRHNSEKREDLVGGNEGDSTDREKKASRTENTDKEVTASYIQYL